MKTKRRTLVKMFLVVLLVATVPAIMFAEGQYEEGTEPGITERVERPPKYAFLFIGDGMGMPQINAAERYLSSVEGGVAGIKKLKMTQFPAQGLTTTYANDRYITGSAAAATAMATGYKTNIGVISMDPSKTRNYKTIAEMAKDAGRKVGIISSVSIDHATPACFYAHQPSRSLYYKIDIDLANSGFDFFGGGGMRQKGREAGDPDAYDVAAQKGYRVVSDKSEFMSLRPGSGKVLAYNPVLAGAASLPYQLDRINGRYGDISLANFTEKAIELLNNENGFFIMVEGGKIDWACHANDATPAIYDTIAFDQAVGEALEFYAAHPDETLIVVTGDHECGGMTLGFAGTKYETSFDLLQHQKRSATDYFAGSFLTDYKEKAGSGRPSINDLMEHIEETFGLVHLSDSQKATLEAKAKSGDKAAADTLKLALSDYQYEKVKDAFEQSMKGAEERSENEETYLLYGGYDPLSVTLSHILNQKAGIGWTSYKHTGVPVPTFATGVGAAQFNGYYDNTDVAKKMMHIMGMKSSVATR
jgi:alkaline phosphatase